MLHRQINWLVLTDWHRTGVAPKIVEMAITNKNQSWFITVVGKFKNTLDKDINVLDKTNTAIGPRSSIFIFQAIDYWPNTFVWIYMSAAIPGTKQNSEPNTTRNVTFLFKHKSDYSTNLTSRSDIMHWVVKNFKIITDEKKGHAKHGQRETMQVLKQQYVLSLQFNFCQGRKPRK